MLSETCFEIDLNFSDVLSNIGDIGSVTTRKKLDSNGNLNSLNLSFSSDTICDYKSNTSTANDILDDDLNALLDSCHVHKQQSSCLISLAALANDHLSNNQPTDKCLSNLFVSSIKNEVSDEIQLLDCLEDILLDNKSDNEIPKSKNVFNFQWGNSSVENGVINAQNHVIEPSKENVEDDTLPDINLSFCVKKNNIDKFSQLSASPESSDSGFDEIGFSTESSSGSSVETSFGISNVTKPSLISSQRSPLSRAISARPKISKSQREKLQDIRKELCRNCMTKAISECKRDRNLVKFENIIDQSSQCIITSCFQTVSGH